MAAAKTFFTWAVKRRHITENPTIAFSLHARPSRSRVLTDDELRNVWIAAEEIGGSFGTIVKLLVLTGQRRGEIAALQSFWIKEDTITLPAEITKNSEGYTFPLSATAKRLLSQVAAGSGYLFLARGKVDSPFNGWSKAKVEPGQSKRGVSDWTLHDIRRRIIASNPRLSASAPRD